MSRPAQVTEEVLTALDREALRRIARKTWHFFETFVTAEDHWLPPDNFQEDPNGVLAPRTSPTNMGLYLLSCVAAHDFGYLSLPALLERLENTLDTFDRLERHDGHFCNWYDTHNLQPLQPVYISTVDSGNLLACLLTLKQGLREKAEERLPPPALCDGLEDTLRLVAEALADIASPAGSDTPSVFQAMTDTVARHEWPAETSAGGPAGRAEAAGGHAAANRRPQRQDAASERGAARKARRPGAARLGRLTELRCDRQQRRINLDTWTTRTRALYP